MSKNVDKINLVQHKKIINETYLLLNYDVSDYIIVQAALKLLS